MVVDDEESLVEAIRYALSREGMEVVTAGDGAQAVLDFERERPDLLVLDLMLPGLSGWDVCRRVRASSEVPILMLTARDAEVDRVVGLEMGADDYVTKPFSLRELVARVRALLRRAGQPQTPAEGSVIEAAGIRLAQERHEVTVRGTPDPATGMVLDLGLLERSMAEVQKTLDHKLLNRIEAIGPPTLENLSRYIFERVQHAGKVTRVSVHRDSCNESCTYYGPEG